MWQAGFNAKIRINGGIFAAQSYRARETAMDQDVSNTEGIPGNISIGGPVGTAFSFCQSRMSSLQHMEAEVRNATFDPLANPFVIGGPGGAPNVPAIGAGQVKAGNYINLSIFVTSGMTLGWLSPSFLVLITSQDMEITRLQPVSFSGMSDGEYDTPYAG